MEYNAITVSDLNQYIKNKIDADEYLNNVLVKGEISNFKHHYTGHMYFTLKDEKSLIKCIMFKGYTTNLNFIPKDGMKVSAFPTDAQPLMLAACLKARGTSVFVENVFQNRFRYTEELMRLGARIHTEGRVAVVTGVTELHGAPTVATDLRGGAALIIAGLSAEGVTEILDSGHIERGYEDLDSRLRELGAEIERSA